MSISTNEKHSLTLTNILTLIVTLILILSVTLTLPKSTSAASKEYEVYKQIKTGMTVTQVAKLIYGKKYKKHIAIKSGVTTFKKDYSYMGVSEDYRLIYEYDFFNNKRTFDDSDIPQISIGLYTMPKGKTLYVGHKIFETLNPTENRLYKNKKPKAGMSLGELDKITYGDGLGVFYNITYENLTFLKIMNDEGKNMFPTKNTTISYSIKNYNDKTGYIIYLKYDYKKKNYYVDDQPF